MGLAKRQQFGRGDAPGHFWLRTSALGRFLASKTHSLAREALQDAPGRSWLGKYAFGVAKGNSLAGGTLQDAPGRFWLPKKRFWEPKLHNFIGFASQKAPPEGRVAMRRGPSGQGLGG